MPRVDPLLDEGMRKWIASTAHKNHKRIANFDVDDLIQEGYLCYYKCKERYVGKRGLRNRYGVPARYISPVNPDKVSRQHFQSLVKTTFCNHIATLVYRQPAGWEKSVTEMSAARATSDDMIWDAITPPEHEVATIGALIRSMPKELKQVFDMLINDAVDGYKRFSSPGRLAASRRPAHRETTDEYWSRQLGLPSFRLSHELERHFMVNVK